MTENTAHEYPRIASILALVGGTFTTLGGVLFLAASLFILPNLSYADLTLPPNFPAAGLPGLVSGIVGLMGAIGLVSGAIVLVSSVMLLANGGQRRTWGVLILVFSALSLFGMGGFIVGAVLGITGGAMVLRWKPPTP